MKQRTQNQKIPNSSRERLQEIGKILSNGIARLEAKERLENGEIPLDNKRTPSLHSIDYKNNQHVMNYD